MKQIPFCGRAPELAAITAHLEEASHGCGRALLIEGEAGIGKTTLLAEAMRRAADLGFRIWSGTAEELDARRPFGALAGCLGLDKARGDRPDGEDPRAEISRLLLENRHMRAPGGFADGAEAHFLVREAFLSFADVAQADGPVAFVIDDLHWADPASLLALSALIRTLERQHLLFLGTARRFPRIPELDRFLGGATSFRLDPLPEAEWATFVEQILGATPGKVLLDGIAVAAGNPLFMSELLGALEQESLLVCRDDGSLDIESPLVPPSLSVTILRRLAFLPPETIEILGIASVLGSSFGVADLQLLLGRRAIDLASGLRPAVKAGILADAGEALAFRHELIRQALYDDMPAALRRALHTDLAEALSAAGAPTDRVAEHMIRGASRGDVRAAGWLVRAAEESLERAPSIAVERLEQALELGGDALRGRALPTLGLALFGAGRLRESESVVRNALAGGLDPTTEGAIRHCLVFSLLLQGRVPEMLAECRAAAAAHTLTHGDVARFVAWESLGSLLAADVDGALARARDAAAAAEAAAGDPQALCMALMVESLVHYMRGHSLEALGAIEEAVRYADANEDGHRSQPLLIYAIILIELDRIEEALVVLDRGRRKAEEFGMGSLVLLYHMEAAVPHYYSGRWDDALAELQASSLILDSEVGLSGESWHVCRAMIALGRDDLAGAKAAIEAVETTMTTLPAMPAFRIEWLAAARAGLLQAGGRLEEARAVVQGMWDGLASLGLGWLTIGLATDMARHAASAGDQKKARAVVAELERIAAATPGVAWIEATLLRCRAIVESDLGGLLAAVERFRASSRVVDLAGALEDAAAALAEAGRPEEARAHLDEALDLYETFGGARYAARAEATARRFGIRRGRRGTRGRPRTGWDSLTQTERVVAGLVGERLTNPQIGARMFISRRTVQTHVSNALGKLGLRSRLELGELARSRSG